MLNASAAADAYLTVTAQVTCVSGPSGIEVVQLYTSLTAPTEATDPRGARSIPVRELIGFQRVFVDAAGKGAASSVVVTFNITSKDLLLVDNDGQQRVRCTWEHALHFLRNVLRLFVRAGNGCCRQFPACMIYGLGASDPESKASSWTQASSNQR